MASVLTSTQERFLSGFFGRAAPPFYLTGGTALAAYYLKHRYSDDLDFFTRAPDQLRVGDSLVEQGVRAAGLSIEEYPARDQPFRRFLLVGDTHPDHPLRKCELMLDSPPFFAEPRWLDGILVDDLLSIAVNKLTALSRIEPKDYVDLHLIVSRGLHRMEDLIPRAQEKDPGLTPLVLAATFDRVDELPDLRAFQEGYMRVGVGVDSAELIRFYRGWARRLVEAVGPAQPPPRRHEQS
jgi:hypothetical protein